MKKSNIRKNITSWQGLGLMLVNPTVMVLGVFFLSFYVLCWKDLPHMSSFALLPVSPLVFIDLYLVSVSLSLCQFFLVLCVISISAFFCVFWCFSAFLDFCFVFFFWPLIFWNLDSAHFLWICLPVWTHFFWFASLACKPFVITFF